MPELEGLRREGIKGVLFDCYRTLIDITTDEDNLKTYEPISKWLIYQGVKVSPEEIIREYKGTCNEEMTLRWEKYPEIKIEEIFSKICSRHALWTIDEATLGVETSRTFRAASLRKLHAYPQSLRMLELLKDYPLGIVSNGQRVFGELELRYLDIYKYFKLVLFSSDFGHKKPDPRIYMAAAKKLELQPEEILFIGDSMENDVIPSIKLGMKSMHINEAWKFFKVE